VTPSAEPPPFTSPVENAAGTEADSKARLTEDTRQEIKARIMEFVGNIRSGALSVTGVVALLAVAISMLARIEDTFNDIWGVTRGRPWHMRVVQYWAAISLGPFLWITAAALTSSPHLGVVRDFVSRFGTLGEVAVKTAMGLLPYVILSVAFGLLYALMPNAKVSWRAAAVGGVVAGVLWQLNQEFSVFYVSRVVSNSRIYGSLGAVPVFMIGLYISWVILLFGAQVAYAYQNRRAYLQERQVELVNQRSREFVALRLVTRIGEAFEQGARPPTLTRLSEDLGVPSRLTNQLLGQLEKAGCTAEVSGLDGGFVPGRPLDRITAADVLRALRVENGRDLATRADPAREAVRQEFDRIGAAEQGVAGGVTVQDLVRHPGGK
jgi:membrane protein